MRIIEGAIGRSRSVMVALIAIMVGGLVAYATLPKEAEPDIEIPVIYVAMSLDGISPEDAERLLVRPVEQELRAIEGVKEMTSSAFEGGANVQLEFDAGVDTDRALQDVREKVDIAKAELPEETDEPTVSEVKLASFDPMLVLNLAGNVPERTLATIARDLKDDLEGLAGVLEVRLVGVREELMEVVIDPLAMESYGLDQTEIFALVDRNNRLVAAGALQGAEGRFPVKVPGVFETADDILRMPIKAQDERIVHFGDIAEVRRTYKDAESYARLNGKPAVAIEVIQRNGSNVLQTIAGARELVAEAQRAWPAGLEVIVSRDKSDDINIMLVDLQNNVLTAVLLVFIVIIGILGLRGAGLVGMAIPGSFLFGLLVLAAFGVTINMMVLFALIMAVGMLVDGAIVVTELADRRMAEGADRREAYGGAAARMAWPIIASTCTTLAAFVPLAFWPGIPGEFMRYLPITLIAVLSASLVMALIFVPTLGALFGKPGTMSEATRHNLVAAETGDLATLTGLTGAYVRFLRGALRRPLVNVALVTAALVAVYAAYFSFGKGVEEFPDVEPEFATVDVRARGDLSVDEKDALVREVEQRILAMERRSPVQEIDAVYAKTGGGGRGAAEDQIGTITLTFADWGVRRPADLILAEIRSDTADLAGVRVQARKPDSGPETGKPVAIELASRFPELLGPATAAVRAELESIDGVINVDDSRPLPGIEWQIAVDRAEAAKFGADIALVGNMIQLVTNGIKIGEYRPNDADEEIEIRVRYPAGSRSLGQLDELRVPTDAGLVPIGTFVDRVPAQKVGIIERTDLRRTMTVEADVEPGVLDTDVVRELSATLPALGIDPRVSVSFRGGSEELAEAMAFLLKAFGVAVAVMALILITQFNSIYQALLILAAVVFSTGGVLLGHLITGRPFGVIMSGIGLVTLAGIVVNNNIVFIDTFNVLRQRGMDAFEATLRTCAVRLRPVLLTTVTTILGLLPMVFGVTVNLMERSVVIGAPSSQWWTQLSSAVAGGLAFATLLTLLMTPSLLVLGARLTTRRRAAAPAETAPAPAG